MASEPTNILNMKTWKFTSSGDVTTALRRYRYGNEKNGYYTRWDVVRNGTARVIYPKTVLFIGGALYAWWHVFVETDRYMSEAMRQEARESALMRQGRERAFARFGFDEETVARYADFIRLAEIRRLQSERADEERTLKERVQRELKWIV